MEGYSGEAERAKGQSESDRAEMYSIKGVVAARNTQNSLPRFSTTSNPLTLDSCSRSEVLILVGLQYALRADAFRELGDYSKAKSDITAALLLVAQTVGQYNVIYATTELIYARLSTCHGRKSRGRTKREGRPRRF